MNNERLVCPTGESNCLFGDEVIDLRKKVCDLSKLVSTDALTGLYNYRHFKIILQAEMDRTKRSGIPTSLVMVDIDHFKLVNDKYGHEIGNLVLQKIATVLTEQLRITDIACRYGGEEFAIIFPETNLRLSVKVADRIRELIATIPIDCKDINIATTVSMGASVYLKNSNLELAEFVDSVDKYLYEAKQSGRNCICHIDYADSESVTEVSLDERAMLFDPE